MTKILDLKNEELARLVITILRHVSNFRGGSAASCNAELEKLHKEEYKADVEAAILKIELSILYANIDKLILNMLTQFDMSLEEGDSERYEKIKANLVESIRMFDEQYGPYINKPEVEKVTLSKEDSAKA